MLACDAHFPMADLSLLWQGLLVQQQPPLQVPGAEISSGRAPAKLNSIQSLETASLQTYSDPSEDIAAALPSSASMQSRPSSKVRPHTRHAGGQATLCASGCGMRASASAVTGESCMRNESPQPHSSCQEGRQDGAHWCSTASSS